MCVFKFRSDATEIRNGTLAIKMIEWSIDAESAKAKIIKRLYGGNLY